MWTLNPVETRYHPRADGKIRESHRMVATRTVRLTAPRGIANIQVSPWVSALASKFKRQKV